MPVADARPDPAATRRIRASGGIPHDAGLKPRSDRPCTCVVPRRWGEIRPAMTTHPLDRVVPARTVDSSAFRQWIPLRSKYRRVRRRLRARQRPRSKRQRARRPATPRADRPLLAVDALKISAGAEWAGASGSAAAATAPARAPNPRAAHTKAPEGTGGRTAGRCAPAPNKSGVVTPRPGSSLAGLAAVEPGSWDRPEDRSPVRPGGSHLPLRARRNVPATAARPQRPYPRTSPESSSAYPRTSTGCGRHVDGLHCNARATSDRRVTGVDSRGR